jgi:predicted nucleic acid-binding protein
MRSGPHAALRLLLRGAEEPALYRAYWSEETTAELRRTLLKFGLTEKQTKRRVSKMEEAYPEARIHIPAGFMAGVPDIPDPSDRHVIAAAIVCKADVIVTSNLKHFPKGLLEPFNLLVHSPDEFLLHQYHLNPWMMLEKLDNQASGIGVSRTKVLERFEGPTPLFVKAIRERQSL